MSATNRVLVVSALVVGLCPALAFACDEEASAKAEAKAEACVKAETRVERCVRVEAKTEACVKTKVINTQGAHRSRWEPGHLIEPDSMKLGPGDDLKAPDVEQWVILSSRAGVIRFHHYPWSKKTEGRTLQQYGPYRS